MPHLPPAHHETSKHDSPNETKIKEKQNETIPNLNSNLAKLTTHHNQTKELTTWFLRELSANFLHRDPRLEGAKAKGHKCGPGLAQKVPDFLRLAHTDSLEVLQPFLSYSQLLHLLLVQPPLPIYHLHSPSI
jgi:hypothetical protein